MIQVKPLLLLLEEKLKIDPEKDRLLLKHMVYEMLLVAKRNEGVLEVSFHDTLL